MEGWKMWDGLWMMAVTVRLLYCWIVCSSKQSSLLLDCFIAKLFYG